MKKKISFLIAILAVVCAAFSLAACGAEEEKLTPINVDIPYVSDFTCDYYTADGARIDDKNRKFAHDGEVRVKISFTLSKEAYAAGKADFTVKFLLPEGFTGRLIEANSSDTVAEEIEATFDADDRQDKKCRVEARIKFNYSSGTLNFGYTYDDGTAGEVGNQPLKCAEAFRFVYDEATDGYSLHKDPDCTEWLANLQELAIPETFAGKPVTSIAAETFSGCEALTSITIPATVTSIGDSAFKDCKQLYSVNIPAAVTEIGKYAFSGCGNLPNVTIPAGISVIEEGAFYGCYGVKSIVIPDGVTSVGNYAFSKCYKLASITIPDSVTNIGDFAFLSSGLKSVTIPYGVTAIGNSVFYNCSDLTDVTIPDGVTSIGDSAINSERDFRKTQQKISNNIENSLQMIA